MRRQTGRCESGGSRGLVGSRKNLRGKFFKFSLLPSQKNIGVIAKPILLDPMKLPAHREPLLRCIAYRAGA